MALCLVVDDEEDHREIAAMLAQSAGLDVESAENGREALDFCKEQMPDVVLLDWMMPEMDGMEFLENLRQLDNGEHPFVIVCSARNSENAIKTAMAAGANAYFPKPFNPDHVVRKLEEAIERVEHG